MITADMATQPPPPQPDKHHGRPCWITRWRGETPDPKTGKPPQYVKRWYEPVTRLEAMQAYARWLVEWENDPDMRDPRAMAEAVTVEDLCHAYLRYAERTYVKRGRQTTHVWNVARAMQLIADSFGALNVNEFAPPQLAKLRDQCAAGRHRGTVNKWLSIIRAAWRWGAERGDVRPEVAQALDVVRNVRKGTPGSQESAPVQPVAWETVEQTLVHCPEPVQALLKLMWWTGCRPDEACMMRGCDLERGDTVWLYRPDPQELKLAHLEDQQDGHERIIHLGPQAQDVIKPWLVPDLSAHLFRPADTARSASTANRYTSASLRRAVHRACDAVWPPPGDLALRRVEAKGRKHWRWEQSKERERRLTEEQRAELQAWRDAHRWSPNQLRHSRATEVRKRYGAEAARVILGHSNLKTTEIYAERDMQLAAQVAKETG